MVRCNSVLKPPNNAIQGTGKNCVISYSWDLSRSWKKTWKYMSVKIWMSEEIHYKDTCSLNILRKLYSIIHFSFPWLGFALSSLYIDQTRNFTTQLNRTLVRRTELLKPNWTGRSCLLILFELCKLILKNELYVENIIFKKKK